MIRAVWVTWKDTYSSYWWPMNQAYSQDIRLFSRRYNIESTVEGQSIRGFKDNRFLDPRRFNPGADHEAVGKAFVVRAVEELKPKDSVTELILLLRPMRLPGSNLREWWISSGKHCGYRRSLIGRSPVTGTRLMPSSKWWNPMDHRNDQTGLRLGRAARIPILMT